MRLVSATNLVRATLVRAEPVYEALQVERVQRSVALKVVKKGMDTRDVLARFEADHTGTPDAE